MDLSPLDSTEYDLATLDRELDKTKAQVFRGKSAAFFGPLMSYMRFIWTDSVPTAMVDGTNFWWNPKWFLAMEPEERKTVLIHELKHVAYLDGIRGMGRCPDKWNEACDHRINLETRDEGYVFNGFAGIGCLMNDDFIGLSAEEIYDIIVSEVGGGSGGGAMNGGDMMEPAGSTEKQAVVDAVMQAVTLAKLTDPSSIPGAIETVLNTFLAPIIPWETVLARFFTELLNTDYDWRVRDRRYSDIYLPGELEDGGRLRHIEYFFDVSGSVTDPMVTRFNSEVKYIKERFKPERLDLIQFDTQIQSITTFKERDRFNELLVKGRGGTSLQCVKEHIDATKPTAAIIFTDLECSPMQPLDRNIPIIWICMGNPNAQVPFGQLLHIKM